MSFFEFDCSDRTFEEIQIFAGFQDSNLDMLSKCFKSVCMIRDQKIKVEVNETLSAHKVEEVIEACFSIIDTQHRLNSQDVSYICSLAFWAAASAFPPDSAALRRGERRSGQCKRR